MKKILYTVLATALLAACADGAKQFTVSGTVSDAAGQTLYLEEAGLMGIRLADSVKVGAGDRFTFRHSAATTGPEFYRLRLGNQVVNFAVDSCESVSFSSSREKFATDYEMGGSSSNAKIKELSAMLTGFQNEVNSLVKSQEAGQMSQRVLADSLSAMVDSYKDAVKRDYIYPEPGAAHAYFALFQQVGQNVLFDPYSNRDDSRVYAAVATSFQNKYPESPRTRNLSNIVLKSMRNARAAANQTLQVEETRVNEAGIIEVKLRDIDGRERPLSELKGKVVILDFTAYQTEVSAGHNYALRDLYDRYHQRGLEIYQISFDTNEHFWKTTADNLPWVCVRDPGALNSALLPLYNVQGLPEAFVVDRQGDLSARIDNMQDLEKQIQKLL